MTSRPCAPGGEARATRRRRLLCDALSSPTSKIMIFRWPSRVEKFLVSYSVGMLFVRDSSRVCFLCLTKKARSDQAADARPATSCIKVDAKIASSSLRLQHSYRQHGRRTSAFGDHRGAMSSACRLDVTCLRNKKYLAVRMSLIGIIIPYPGIENCIFSVAINYLKNDFFSHTPPATMAQVATAFVHSWLSTEKRGSFLETRYSYLMTVGGNWKSIFRGTTKSRSQFSENSVDTLFFLPSFCLRHKPKCN